MRFPTPPRPAFAVLAILLVTACDGSRPIPHSPTAPGPPGGDEIPAPPRADSEIYLGDALVESRTGSAGCGWGTLAGESRAGVRWRVAIRGDSIALDEDLDNWPTDHIGYQGKLQGRSFTASFHYGPDYLRWICQFREAWLSGTFSPDFNSFEAHETVIWGPPSGETRVERSWTVRREP
jgi:hypothetical protein